MKIRILEENDLAFVADLQPEGWSDIMPTIEFYTKSDFCFPLKVLINNNIAGIGASIIHHDIAWLGHIIVHPSHRNKGIGKFITQTLTNSLHEKGIDTIYLIATDLGVPVYERTGFETETEYLFFKDVKPAKNLALSENIKEFENTYTDQIIKLDYEVSGENRIFHIESHLSGGYVYNLHGLVEGYYLPTFGEGLIVADSHAAGLELMKLRLTTRENAVFPVNNLIATEFMRLNNFKEFKSAKRMSLGKKKPWKPENIYNRIGGNLG